ncbi:protein tyrosine phosphatase-like protein, PTPLA domain-containing protein [Hirsutella rhossiliensis]|uniref:Very-long-chain (3R)-3-hydroxyacyl-CoA dehydratase n=1 Tax=Hirsutella rhossiliensis TaxID=111463 RepID=A0A9P8MXR0_9HYPO|nr:protein tyrosine phosphatase-like protein, PTPLA domain-containing protein [Hirsutella rhossiliensis]KAH0962917.1 protein tyrosine phosphatase-like protein, PTPLA domain-containing protein [Hirsutella rhossiliensis]
MASPSSKQPSKAPSSPLKTAYLVLYNAASAAAWAVVLARTVSLCALPGPLFVYDGVGQWAKWTQTMAAMEILHSTLGVVRAPLFTTLMQVSSRFLLVWAIVDSFPFLAFSPVYSSMLVAWSVTEVIRYSYFALSLSGWQPAALTWLRYNTFFVLYPVGILSECSLIYMAADPAGMRSPLEKYLLYAILVIYVPGAYVLYTHMMTQRKKIMRAKKAKGDRATR